MDSVGFAAIADFMAQIEAEQRKRMSEICIALNPADHDRVRALLDDAGYDLIVSRSNVGVAPGQMIIMDAAQLKFIAPWSPEWDDLEGGEEHAEALSVPTSTDTHPDSNRRKGFFTKVRNKRSS